ncbi:MAG: C39 family peptidase [Allomuricauda sp.]
METLMREVKTTKKKTATYYLHLATSDDKDVKVRIDLKQIDAEIPLYKSESFDIKKLMALKEESLTQPKQKLEVIDAKSTEWRRLENEVKALTKERDALKADTLSLDSTAIAKVEEDLQDKMKNFKKVDAEVTKIFKEYEAMMDSIMGNLRTQYNERLVAAMEEAYEKIENKETTFKSVDDDATFWDIRLDLLKIDATREMKIPRRLDGGGETTEQITAGKLYYLLHFAEFGSMFEEEEVKKVFSAIKLWEFHLNPYLVDKQFGLVCDDQYRTQHYINSVVDYKNYRGDDYWELERYFLDDKPLNYKEIAEVRALIKLVEDQERKKQFYLDLQKKVPYYSQIDNVSNKHRSCNVTSLAMNLNFMGKGVDDIRLSDNLLARSKGKKITRPETWRRLASEFEIKSNENEDQIELYEGNNKVGVELKTYLTNLMLPVLERGSSISLSLFPPCKGHIVRVQEVKSTGLVIDDPYGYCPLDCILMRESCKKNSYTTKGERNDAPNYYGNDILYTWEVLSQITLKYMVIFNE